MVTGILLTLFYAILFIIIIGNWKFFNVAGIQKRSFKFIFLLKVLFGTALWAVYTFYYTSRDFADCYKYFDDSYHIYSSLFENPLHYLKLMLGIDTKSADLQPYISKMGHWNRPHSIDTIFNNNRLIIRFNALVYIFSFGVFHVHTVFMSFLSLIGLTAFYKTFVPYLSDKKGLLFVGVFLFPSVIFWSSGVLKEGIVTLGIGLCCWCLIKLFYEKEVNFSLISTLVLAILIIGFCKVYILFALIPGILLIVFYAFQTQKKTIRSFTFTVIFISACLFAAQFLKGYANPYVLISKKKMSFNSVARGGSYLVEKDNVQSDTLYFTTQQTNYFIATHELNFYRIKRNAYYTRIVDGKALDTIAHNDTSTVYRAIVERGKVGSGINFNQIKPTLWSFLLNTPKAIITALYRPLFIDARGVLMLLSSVENLILLLLFPLALLLLNKQPNHFVLAVFCVFFCLSLATLTGISNSILGAIVRYKMPLIPFYFTACLLLVRSEDVKPLEKKIAKLL
jgi:hypothetical protein